MKGVLDPTNLVDCQQRLSTTDSIPSMESVSKEMWRPYVDHIGPQAVKNVKDEDGQELKQFWKSKAGSLPELYKLASCYCTTTIDVFSHPCICNDKSPDSVYTPIYSSIPLVYRHSLVPSIKSPCFLSLALLFTSFLSSLLLSILFECLKQAYLQLTRPSLVISMLYNVSLCLYRYSMIVRLSSQHT